MTAKQGAIAQANDEKRSLSAVNRSGAITLPMTGKQGVIAVLLVPDCFNGG